MRDRQKTFEGGARPTFFVIPGWWRIGERSAPDAHIRQYVSVHHNAAVGRDQEVCDIGGWRMFQLQISMLAIGPVKGMADGLQSYTLKISNNEQL